MASEKKPHEGRCRELFRALWPIGRKRVGPFSVAPYSPNVTCRELASDSRL
jgi:hypothetical protein